MSSKQTSKVFVNAPSVLGFFVVVSITVCYIDLLGINLFGMNLRVGQAILPLMWMIVGFRLRVSIPELLSIMAFLILISWSVINSSDAAKSFSYLVWVLHSFIFVYLFFRDVSSRHAVDIERALVIAARVQIMLAVMLVILGVQQRGHVLFYEASYFAIALIPYVAITVTTIVNRGAKSSLLDIILLIAALLATQSATLIIAMFLVVALVVLSAPGLSRKVVAFSFVVVSMLGGYMASVQAPNSLIGVFFSNIYNDPADVIFFLAERGGNRIPRIELGFDVWRSSPWTGVGVGAYESYIDPLDVSSYAPIWWMSPAGQPVSSIYVELLATGGILGLVGFLCFVAVVFYKMPGGAEYRWLWIALISTLIILSIEANYLRMYLWMLFGICAGIGARMADRSKPVLASA